jgi:hypothetical protein
MRKWLYGAFLIRGQVSLTVAPGGTGKSILSISEALAQISGRTLLHDEPHGQSNVWLWNGEDPSDELQRRITGAALHHGILPNLLQERLFVDSGRQTRINIAYAERGGVLIAEPNVEALIETIQSNKIDVAVIDPLVSSHSVGENDNNAMDAVVKTYARIADVTGAAFHLVHHPRKTGGANVTAEDARGGGALVAGVRAARTMNVMTPDEAAKAGVDNRYRYVRIDDAKANLAPRSDVAQWVEIKSVALPNGAGGVGGTIGDHVGVVVRWRWPDAMEGITSDDLAKVQGAIATGKWRENVQAKEWVGRPIAEVLGLDLEKPADKAKVAGLVKRWIKLGHLTVVTGQDSKGNDRPFVEVGKPAPTIGE